MSKAEFNRKLINDYLDCWERGDIETAQIAVDDQNLASGGGDDARQ